jgi:hypothetical protein
MAKKPSSPARPIDSEQKSGARNDGPRVTRSQPKPSHQTGGTGGGTGQQNPAKGKPKRP